MGKFVEFFGPGVTELSLADRATISNMCPEYGATTAFFPVDKAATSYLRQTGMLHTASLNVLSLGNIYDALCMTTLMSNVLCVLAGSIAVHHMMRSDNCSNSNAWLC